MGSGAKKIHSYSQLSFKCNYERKWDFVANLKEKDFFFDKCNKYMHITYVYAYIHASPWRNKRLFET